MTLPPGLEALKIEAMSLSCNSWALMRRWPLSKGIDRSGPCPVCGGTDRFSIHTKKNIFNCRRCGISGEGIIALVMATETLQFREACELITGRRATDPVDPAKLAKLEAQRKADDDRRAADAERYRENARRAGYDIWQQRGPIDWNDATQPVTAYLARRGIRLGMGDHELLHGTAVQLREAVLDYRYQRQDRAWVTLHTGPAMIAAVQRPDGTFGAVHQTWIDLSTASGKVALVDPENDKDLPAKKVLGSKKGGAIRLYTPPKPRRLVMGEGIETTLTPLVHNFEPDTAYWAGVDLGNMAGKALRDGDGKQIHDEPDLDDRECFLPPDWCEELVYLTDGDEPSKHTVEQVTRGLRRAAIVRAENVQLPALATFLIEPVGEGKDINDLVRVG